MIEVVNVFHNPNFMGVIPPHSFQADAEDREKERDPWRVDLVFGLGVVGVVPGATAAAAS